jgi:hypothetical protein
MRSCCFVERCGDSGASFRNLCHPLCNDRGVGIGSREFGFALGRYVVHFRSCYTYRCFLQPTKKGWRLYEYLHMAGPLLDRVMFIVFFLWEMQ